MEPGQILDPQRVTGERWALLEEKTVQSLCCLSSLDLMEPGNWRVFILRLRRGFGSEMHQGPFCNIVVAGRVDPCNKRWPPLCMSRLLMSADLRPARWVLSFKLPRLAGMRVDFLSSVFYCSLPNLFVSPHLNIYFRISLIFFFHLLLSYLSEPVVGTCEILSQSSLLISRWGHLLIVCLYAISNGYCLAWQGLQ